MAKPGFTPVPTTETPASFAAASSRAAASGARSQG